MAITLHCVACWWTTDNARATRCARCKEPLHLPDGRLAHEVVATAHEQAKAYIDAGYDPAYAPGVVAAGAILTSRRGGSKLTWVSATRLMLWANLLVTIVVLVVNVWESQVFKVLGGSVLGASLKIVLVGEILFFTVITALLVWAMRFAVLRIILLFLLTPFFIKYASLPLLPIVVGNLVFYALFAFTLVMSLVSPSRYVPGNLSLDARSLTLFGATFVVLIGVFAGLAAATYHTSPKVLNQAQVTLNS